MKKETAKRKIKENIKLPTHLAVIEKLLIFLSVVTMIAFFFMIVF